MACAKPLWRMFGFLASLALVSACGGKSVSTSVVDSGRGAADSGQDATRAADANGLDAGSVDARVTRESAALDAGRDGTDGAGGAGASCTASSSCPSGLCLGNVCCLASCAGGGVCSAVACSPGTGACVYPTAPCSTSSCAGGIETPASLCASGACQTAIPHACGAYPCNDAGTACATSCTNDTDCVAGDFCNAGACASSAAPALLVFSTQPTNAAAGVRMAPAVVVLIEDASGNVVTSSSAMVTLAIGNNPGVGGLQGTPSEAAVGGGATFADLRIQAAAVGYTLIATAPGLGVPAAESAPFNITPGAPVALFSNLLVDPFDLVADGVSSAMVNVYLSDASGNPVVGQLVTMSATGTGPTFSPVMSGTTGVHGTFTTSLTSTVAEPTTVTATIVGYFQMTQQLDFGAGPPAAANSTMIASPTSIPAGGASASQITVKLFDKLGNPVIGEMVTLSATGSGNLLWPMSGSTDTSGTFTSSFSSTVAEPVTITATAGTLTFHAGVTVQ